MAKSRLYILKPGEEDFTFQDLDHTPKLEELQAAVGGGYIEQVPGFHSFMPPGMTKHVSCKVYADEEGKLRKQLFNRRATELWAEALGISTRPDYLVGQICIVVTGKALESIP